MSIHKDLSELLKADIISQDIADKIEDYYKGKGTSSTQRLYVMFGILGAILIGLGLILIIAHNWDELPRSTKTFFAVLPTLIGQLACGYVLLMKRDNVAWREASAAFLFFAVGATISLISQIYHIPGNLSSFMLSWMLLVLPLVYLLKTSVTSMLYIIGITTYVCEALYFTRGNPNNYWYWLLLLAILPEYYRLYKHQPFSNFMIFHNWLIPLSLVISLGTLAHKNSPIMYIAYFSLFGLFYGIGNTAFFKSQRSKTGGYRFLSEMGTLVLLLMLSFDWMWKALQKREFVTSELIVSPELISVFVLTLAAFIIFYRQHKGKNWKEIYPISTVFIAFVFIFLIGLGSLLAILLVNICLFILGVWVVKDGANKNSLGRLNYGLLILVALVLCRFFDENLSFVLRGSLFVGVGIGFFVANYKMIKKKRNEA